MATYIHFSCSKRRPDILIKGLISGENACLDNNPSRDLFFVRWHSGVTPKKNGKPKQVDNDKALMVLCYVKAQCRSEGHTLDTWLFQDIYNMIIPHTLPGEYKINHHHPEQQRWARQIAPARVRPELLTLLTTQEDFTARNLNSLRRFLFAEDDQECKDLLTISI